MYVRIDTGDIYLNFKTLIYSPDAEELKEIQDNQNAILGEGIPHEMEDENEEDKNSIDREIETEDDRNPPIQSKAPLQNTDSTGNDYISALINKYKIPKKN